MVISKVVSGSVFPLSMALKIELIQDRAIKNSEQRWMTPLRIWITQTERCGGGLSKDRIFCLWKEKTARLLLSSSVGVPSIASSSRIDFFFHIFLFQFFVVDRLSAMARWQKCQLSNRMFIRQVGKSSRNSAFPVSRFPLSITTQVNELWI